LPIDLVQYYTLRIEEEEDPNEHSAINATRSFSTLAIRNRVNHVCLCRKNHQRAMESMQASLESEQRSKAEALRIKKKLEGDINELEIALDHSNKANSEAQKSIKRYQVPIGTH
jgi:myosin protein heavy chain